VKDEANTTAPGRYEWHWLAGKFFDCLVDVWPPTEYFTADGTLNVGYANTKSSRSKYSVDDRLANWPEDDDPGDPSVCFRV
jgi:hypothetical protein